MPAYDTSFHPPAPVVDVTVAHPVAGTRGRALRAKLDCGADGTYAWRPVFYVRMRVEAFDLAVVRCVAADRTTVLVGRNVLNRFILILNGKQLTFDLQDP